MTKQEPKVHVIKDETLGGIEREYIEVDRKAEVGDKVVSDEQLGFVERVYDVYHAEAATVLGRYSNGHTNLSKYRVLEPTDVVHINGERYRLVERKAEVGEKVLIVSAEHTFEKYGNGDVIIAESADTIGICNSSVKTTEDEGSNEDGFIADREYRVLVPVANEATENCCEADVCVTESQASPQVIVEVDESHASPAVVDMLANLSRRIVTLESQLTATQRNVETLARELEGVKHAQKPSSAHLLAEAFEALARHEGGASR